MLFIQKALLCFLVVLLFVYPVFATENENPDDVSGEGNEIIEPEVQSGNVENQSNSMDSNNDSNEADTLVALDQIIENQGEILAGQEMINDSLMFLAACVLLGAGCVTGFLAGKEIGNIWLS